jgi:diamine N-acetyltransferase
MTVVIRPLTSRNWEFAAKLEVSRDQQRFIETNVWSIAESRFHPELQPMGIYDGGTMIGFLMWGIDADDHQPWLYRFMIDQRYQQRGLGKAAMRRLFDLIREQQLTQLNVGYNVENEVAARFYKALGFHETGLAPWGEMTARIEFGSSSED